MRFLRWLYNSEGGLMLIFGSTLLALATFMFIAAATQ